MVTTNTLDSTLAQTAQAVQDKIRRKHLDTLYKLGDVTAGVEATMAVEAEDPEPFDEFTGPMGLVDDSESFWRARREHMARIARRPCHSCCVATATARVVIDGEREYRVGSAIMFNDGQFERMADENQMGIHLDAVPEAFELLWESVRALGETHPLAMTIREHLKYAVA